MANEWIRTAAIRREIELDEWVVMPNHLHGIIVIADNVGAHGRAPLPDDAPCDVPTSTVFTRPPKSLGSLIAGFKSAVTKRINELRKTPGAPVWQRNYYEHIVRDENELNQIRQYIMDNPAKWETDRYYLPDNVRADRVGTGSTPHDRLQNTRIKRPLRKT